MKAHKSHDKFFKEFYSSGTNTKTLYKGFDTYLDKCGFKAIGEGDFRRVYARGSAVIKVPINRDGLIDNVIEAKAWAKYKNNCTDLGIQLAPCRLLKNLALMMVRVTWTSSIHQENWVDILDCCQAGVYHSKAIGKQRVRVAAYDYALNITEREGWERRLGVEDSFFQDKWLPDRPELIDAETAF